MRIVHRCCLLLLLLLTASAVAQISPGELSKFHTNFEGLDNCTKCHELGKEVTNNNCLVCHTLIRDRMSARAGYHNSEEVRSVKCSKCHAEHYDLDFELVYWKEGREKFDHKKAGWPLEGAHSRVECRTCHTSSLLNSEVAAALTQLDPQRTFLGLGSACLDCHANEHQGKFAEQCINCHTQIAWAPASGFNHNKTEYSLTGKHLDAACEKCHALQPVTGEIFAGKIQKKERVGFFAKYDGLEFQSCMPCHEDTHRGKFGTDCAACHTTADFKQLVRREEFDHSKTGYPLAGLHIGVDCAKCHVSGKMTDPVRHAACADCHRDEHRGQFSDRTDGGTCESCHSINGFLPANYGIADHEKSRYPLTGSHLAVPCFACHAQVTAASETFANFEFKNLRCLGCHTDVHRGQLTKYIDEGGCEYCHNTSTWHEVSFDHGKARFPLIGKHETTACMGCHMVENPGTEAEIIRMSPLTRECAMCHVDPHYGQFLRADQNEELTVCNRCHTPDSWKTSTFEHNRDARYALDGAHTKLQCIQCHMTVAADDGGNYIKYKPLGVACADCHALEPILNNEN